MCFIIFIYFLLSQTIVTIDLIRAEVEETVATTIGDHDAIVAQDLLTNHPLKMYQRKGNLLLIMKMKNLISEELDFRRIGFLKR